MPHHSDARVTVYAGDCLDVLSELDDCSVDAVCCDPPYGLEFMGKEWDGADGFRRSMNPADAGRDSVFGRTSHTSPEYRTDSKATAGMSKAGIGERETPWPSHLGGLNPKCRNCQKWQRGGSPCNCDAPDFPNERLPRMHTFQQWCELWAAECLRVLKPGGHMLAFGGTRTWHRLACAIEDAGFEVRDSIAWLYGSGFPKSLDVSKAIDKADGATREVVGLSSGSAKRSAVSFQAHDNPTGYNATPEGERIITAPATVGARTWQGWGTALKPSHEPVVVAFKPLDDLALLARIGSHLDTLEQTWQAREADPTTRTGEAADSPAATDTSWSESSTTTPSNTVTSWRACWVELCELTSTSTTSTTSETTTVLRTLLSSISRLTDESTPAPATSPPGSTSIASAVDNLFASAVCASRATLALSATEPATSSTQPSRRDGAARTGFEPIVVARKPLQSTVAANVLAHGTGALNIDACRIGMSQEDADFIRKTARPNSAGLEHVGDVMNRPSSPTVNVHPAGRWPANVVLDESQAAALDAMSGERHAGGHTATSDGAEGTATIGPTGLVSGRAIPGVNTYSDSGGASRFFYTAKAPGTERVKLNGTAHPTVKPLDLMRWLVRLVTPPGGVVLDPFAGSGTTVEACLLEGCRCIAIEREPDYLPLIMQRINRRIDPVAAVKATADDGGLFDLLGEGIA